MTAQHNASRATPLPHGWAWRLAFFLALFLALQSGYGSMRGGALERAVIDIATVSTAVMLVNTLSPEIGVRAVGPRMAAEGGGLNILNGCEGTDVLFLLVAAMLVAPIAWRWRALGLLVGVPLVFALNLVRVLVLFYAFRSDRELFELLHGAVAPMVLVLLVGTFFMLWLDRFAPGGTVAPA